MKKKKKTVLITGAAERFGACLAEAYANQGADLILHFNQSAAAIRALEQRLRKKGARVQLVQADLSTEAGMKKLLRQASPLSQIDILVNNASVYQSKTLPSITVKDWDKTMALNLRTPFYLSSQIGLKMKKGGVIINIADASACKPHKNYLSYLVSKMALRDLTKVLALELAPKVRVNSVSPGPLEPAVGRSLTDQRALAKRIPLKKWGGFPALVAAVFYVADADFLTGADVVLDGGFRYV